MKNTQSWGWLTAGVLALGLNGVYQDGGSAWAHQVVDPVIDRIEARIQPALALATGRADWFLAKANIAKTRMVAAQDETASCRMTAAVERAQTRIARTQNGLAQFEVMSAREEAALDRLEAQRDRITAQVARVRVSPVAFETMRVRGVACSRVRVNIPQVSIPRIRIPQAPMVKIPASVVQIDMQGAGPV